MPEQIEGEESIEKCRSLRGEDVLEQAVPGSQGTKGLPVNPFVVVAGAAVGHGELQAEQDQDKQRCECYGKPVCEDSWPPAAAELSGQPDCGRFQWPRPDYQPLRCGGLEAS